MQEFLPLLVDNVPWAVVGAIAAGALRAVGGWFENALKDGKIEPWEWKQLGGTMIKYFTGILLLSPALGSAGAVAGAFGLDIGASAIKSLNSNDTVKKK